MNSQLRSLFVAVIDNEVICFDTNLVAFSKAFVKYEPQSPNYDKFHRLFKKPRFALTLSDKTYYFQKLV